MTHIEAGEVMALSRRIRRLGEVVLGGLDVAGGGPALPYWTGAADTYIRCADALMMLSAVGRAEEVEIPIPDKEAPINA